MITQLVVKIIQSLPVRLRNSIRYKKIIISNQDINEIIFTNKPNSIDLIYSKFTVGQNKNNYLTLGVDEYLWPIRNGSVHKITIHDYFDNFLTIEQFNNFFAQCHRLLGDKGILSLQTYSDRDDSTSLDRHLWDKLPDWCETNLDASEWLQHEAYSGRGNLPDRLFRQILGKYFLKSNSSVYIKKSYTRSEETYPTLNNLSGNANVYLGYADPMTIMNKVGSRVVDSFYQSRKFITVAGSGMYLNIIPIISPSEIIIFDINKLQINYTKILIRLIQQSPTREAFLTHLFSRKYMDNPKQFLIQKCDSTILKETKRICLGLPNFKETIEAIAMARYREIDKDVHALSISNNSYCQNLVFGPQNNFYPGTNINYWSNSDGFLKNNENFQAVKKLLSKAKTMIASIDDPSLLTEFSPNTIAYVTNIGEVDWLRGTLTHVENADQYVDKLKHLIPDAGKDFFQAWKNEYKGFTNFLHNQRYNIWIIDVIGNIISMKTLEKNRLSAHSLLWKYLQPKIIGKTLEIIHKEDGKWGFHEYLETQNFKTFLNSKKIKKDTFVTHLLLHNQVPVSTFASILSKASLTAKRVIIIEHDYSDVLGSGQSYGLDQVLNIIRSIPNLSESQISIEITGSGHSDEKSGIPLTNFRNYIISCEI